MDVVDVALVFGVFEPLVAPFSVVCVPRLVADVLLSDARDLDLEEIE